MSKHGGQLIKASQKYGIPLEDWLDLSTGINPVSYPVKNIPASVLNQLPENDDRLIHAAKAYYKTQNVLTVSGSQWAIEQLPFLFPISRVGVINPSYYEHALQWQKAGHQIIEIIEGEVDNCLSDIDILIIINPNNPTGKFFSKKQLLSWHDSLQKKGGTLIIDEAFMDITPNKSLVSDNMLESLIILRSIGKFFGLAGIRIGFVIAEPKFLLRLKKCQGLWAISNTSAWIAEQALRDLVWQKKMRLQLPVMRKKTVKWLESIGLRVSCATDLFIYVQTEEAEKIYLSLAKLGVLVRYFEEDNSLRFGLIK